MNLQGIFLNIMMKSGLNKKMVETARAFKKEANLPGHDWNHYIRERMLFPPEVQTVVEAPNEDHVRLYDEDLEKIREEKEKTWKRICSMIPNYRSVEWLEGTIELHTKRIITIIASVDKKPGTDMSSLSTKLYLASGFLYEGNSEDVDLALSVQIAYNAYETLLEESEKNVRIAQKGKSGEDYVSSVLRQCRGRFHYLENVVIPAYGESGKTSETDVYIINSKGVFVCEVKNYGTGRQTIVMPPSGEWEIYENDRFLKNKPSAFVQNERHCNATAAFLKEHLGKEVPIIPVVVIANDEVMIDNRTENAVIRAWELPDFVENWQDAVDQGTQQEIVRAFEENMLDVNDFPVKLNRDRAAYISGFVEELIPYLQVNEKIAVELTEMYNRGNLLSKALVFAVAVLVLIPAVNYGIVGIVLTVILLAMVCGTTSTLATIIGCISMLSLLVVYQTESAFCLGITVIGTLLSAWLSGCLTSGE